jgi:D-alanine transaminase
VGAFEAWFVDDGGRVTEGSSTNAWIVTAAGAIVTRNAETGILRGIARTVILDVIAGEGMRLEERPFSLKDALQAREAFNTSATGAVTPVVQIDGTRIGDGKPGTVTRALQAAFYRYASVAPLRAAAIPTD